MPAFIGSHTAQATPDSAITPYRSASLALDLTETVLNEPGLKMARKGVEVARRAAEGTASPTEWQNVSFCTTGHWHLDFIQKDLANLYETVSGQSLIIPQSGFQFVQAQGGAGTIEPLFVALPTQSQGVIGGAYGPGVPPSGDPFFRKVIPSGGTAGSIWNPATYAPNAGFDAALPLIPYENTDVVMDRVAVSTAPYASNTGFCLRWRCHGTFTSFPRYLMSLMFGQYGLTICGDGQAILWEYCTSSAGTLRWVRRKKFQLMTPGTAPASGGAVIIYPHMGYQGGDQRYIAFPLITGATAARVNTADHTDSHNTSPGTEVYKYDSVVRGGDLDSSPGLVTAAGNLHIDVRRDLRIDWQVSTLGFQTSGTLLDDDQLNGGGAFTENTNPVSLTPMAVTPTGCTLTGTGLDAATETAFVPGTSLFYQANFTFTGNGSSTPTLWGYTAMQPDTTMTVSPGAFTVVGTSYDITGFAGDPIEEAASVHVKDPAGEYGPLATRSYFSAALATTYTPPGTSTAYTVTLFRGYVTSPASERVGPARGLPYPVDGWREYDLTMQGMALRLTERTDNFVRSFAVDPTAPLAADGTQQPYKVTDVVRLTLMAAGFPASQINIPDVPIRLWYGASAQADETTIQPTAHYSDFLNRMVRDYLGAGLYFEPNSGPAGQWILIFGTQPTSDGSFAPVYNFVTSPVGGGPALAPLYHPGAFPANTTFIGERPSFHVNKPDFNGIEMSAAQGATTADTRLQTKGFAYNFLSYAVPGATVVPTSPYNSDFIGHPVTFRMIAPDLQGVPYSDTQTAVNFYTVRYYNFLCHSQRIARFKAPMSFVQDSSMTAGGASGGYRLLRWQDPISIDGDASWLVKSIHYHWDSDRLMTMEVEAIQPFPGQMFIGADGREYQRREARRLAARVGGISTHGSMFGQFGTSGHKEQSHLSLPVVRQHFGPIQNPDGSFLFMAGLSPVGTSPLP